MQSTEDETRQREACHWMAAIVGRDRSAFGALYDRFSDAVYAYAVSLMRSDAEAQDVTQEVFLKVWRAADRYDPELGKVISWLLTITRNLCLNRHRSRQRRDKATLGATEHAKDVETPVHDAGQVLLSRETADAVRKSLATLPEEQRHAIELAFLHGFTQTEIADSLGEPLGTIKARIRRGMLRMRESLTGVWFP